MSVTAHDKCKGIAGETPKSFEGKKCINAMLMYTSKWIILIEKLLPLEKWKKSKLFRKQLRRKPRIKF